MEPFKRYVNLAYGPVRSIAHRHAFNGNESLIAAWDRMLETIVGSVAYDRTARSSLRFAEELRARRGKRDDVDAGRADEIVHGFERRSHLIDDSGAAAALRV